MLTIVGMLVAQDTDRAKPATTETDDLVAFAQGANSDRADRGIQPRHVPAAGENTDHTLLGGDVHHIGLNPARFDVSFTSIRMPRDTLRGSVRLCHLRLFFNPNRKSRGRYLLG